MKDPEEAHCGICRFFVAETAKYHGHCRRYPPTVHGVTELTGGGYGESSYLDGHSTERFPCVGADDWCGEFKR